MKNIKKKAIRKKVVEMILTSLSRQNRKSRLARAQLPQVQNRTRLVWRGAHALNRRVRRYLTNLNRLMKNFQPQKFQRNQ